MRVSPNPSDVREIELKLEVESGQVERLTAHPFFHSADAAVRKLENVYFDTGKHALLQNGITLRVRHDGGGYTQTIKAERRAAGLALDRGEWEHELTSAELDFEQAAGTPLEPFIRGRTARQKLKPVFTVQSERVVSRVSNPGSMIELALDMVRIDAAGRHVAFAEVELELKAGDAKDLFAAALNLAEAASLRLSRKSKADRGYGLLQKSSPKSVKAETVLLKPDLAIAPAFQVISNSCLRQLIDNEALVREAPNPEALHQARVAIRRLRAAISVFKDIVTDEEVDAIKSELKWIADKLGKARDLDVFIAKSLEPNAKGDVTAVIKGMLAVYRRRRDDAYAGAIEAIRSERFSRAVLSVAAWIETGPWLTGGGGDVSNPRREPIGPFARAEFDRRWRKARARLKRIDKVDEETRHRARIEIKKVRYAAEFFFPLFKDQAGERRLQTTLKTIEGLQTTLGDLNDIAVARSLVGSAATAPILTRRQNGAPELLLQAKDQARQFRSVEPFWRPDNDNRRA